MVSEAMMDRCMRALAVTLVVPPGNTGLANGHVSMASVTGVVTDSARAVIPGSRVTIRNLRALLRGQDPALMPLAGLTGGSAHLAG